MAFTVRLGKGIRSGYIRCIRSDQQSKLRLINQFGQLGKQDTNLPLLSENYRWYSPLSNEEEEEEKRRVALLSEFQKDQELRKLNREIARLSRLKAINTGEAFTYTGQFKELSREYAIPLTVYYWVVWTSTAGLCYGGITVFGIDVLSIISQIDSYLDWSLASKIDPSWGKLGITLVANELLEPIRLPFVVLTVKPVMERFFPSRY